MDAESQRILLEVDRLLDSAQSNIAVPYSAINQSIADLLTSNEKRLTRITNTILKHADRAQTTAENLIDPAVSTVLGQIDQYIQNNSIILRDIAAYSGDIKPGEPLENLLLDQAAKEPEQAYLGTLVLAVRELEPLFERLVGVLEEIRDRMPVQTAQEYQQEEAAEEVPKLPVVTVTAPAYLPIDDDED